jgi:hypothetical protein
MTQDELQRGFDKTLIVSGLDLFHLVHLWPANNQLDWKAWGLVS